MKNRIDIASIEVTITANKEGGECRFIINRTDGISHQVTDDWFRKSKGCSSTKEVGFGEQLCKLLDIEDESELCEFFPEDLLYKLDDLSSATEGIMSDLMDQGDEDDEDFDYDDDEDTDDE